MMSSIRLQWNDAQWFNWGYTTSRVSGNSFTVVTASWNTVTVANVFATGGRIRIHDTAATLYATITTVSVSAASVQVSFTPDSGSLTATASAVYNSIITADQKSIPSGSVPADVVKQSGAQIYGVDSGMTDAYAIAMTPTLTAYAAGESFNFKANTANTGAATLNIDGIGAKSIVNADGSALSDNTIVGGQIVHVVYDGTNFQIIGSTSGGSSSTAGRLLNQQILTSGSGTYTPTLGTNTITVQLVGGGGGSGGVAGSGSTSSAAGGGGAGGFCLKYIASLSGTYTYSIGTGGAGGASGTHSGSSGTDTTFSNGVITLTGAAGGGGTGGTDISSGSNAAAGGAGGAGSGGDLNHVGGSGYPGLAIAGSVALGGSGGISIFGYQTRGGVTSGAGFGGGDAATLNSGGGGGGSATVNNNPSTGQAGGSGVILISEYS